MKRCRRRLFTRLAYVQPALAASPLRTRPASRELFGSTSVLSLMAPVLRGSI